MTGGLNSMCVIHELLPKAPETALRMPGDEDDMPLVAACASSEVTVLARGTRVAAVRFVDGKALCATDVEAEVGAGFFPLVLQPTGGQVAVCMQKINNVSLRDLHDNGKEIKQLTGGLDGTFLGVNYSSDGSLVLVFSTFGTKVYKAATGELLRSLVDKKGVSIHNCTTDPSGKFLVTTGNAGAAFVKDRDSGENVHALDDPNHTGGVSFDDAGKRILLAEGMMSTTVRSSFAARRTVASASSSVSRCRASVLRVHALDDANHTGGVSFDDPGEAWPTG